MTISKEKTPWGRGSYHRARSGKKDTYNRPDYALYESLKARLTAGARTPEEHEAAARLAALKAGI